MEYTNKMDRRIEKKRGLRAIFRKKNLVWLPVVVFAVAATWAIARQSVSSLRVDGGMITVGEAAYGEFDDYIRVQGQALPITTVQVSPLEGGIVERIVVEEGASVRRGDVIVVLGNNNLNLDILNSEAQLAEKENFLRNTLIAMEQERLNLRQERLQLDMEVRRKERRFAQNEQLYAERLISREEWLESKEDCEVARDRQVLVLERQKQDSLYRTVQVEQLEESLDNMRRNMTLIRQRVDNLNIKSPVDGELGMLGAELGQSVSMGQRIGQVNDLSDFKIEAQVDESYIDRVRAGLGATFERQGTQFDITLRKVYPEVRDGRFRADFVFGDRRPDNIRSGQTYSLNLQLGQSAETLMIPRGSFFAATGGQWVYVLSKDGARAYKRPVRLGRQNPQYYEVLEGLDPGERVIVSGYDGYGDKDMLILK
jgi:HlyD family secretion protein